MRAEITTQIHEMYRKTKERNELKTSKKMLVSLLVAIMLLMTVPAAMAATDLSLTWNGIGDVDAIFTSDDDAIATLAANGWTSGAFYGQDLDNNPYGYGVDNGLFEANGLILGGGDLTFQVDRTDAYPVGMYGPAGQQSYSYVGTDGTGYLNWQSSTNFASMSNDQYGSVMPNFGVAGSTSGLIQHSISGASGDYGLVSWAGSGAADIRLMGDSASTGFNLGHLPTLGHGEAWDNNFATFDGAGAGQFQVTGFASNGINVHEGAWGIPGDGSLGSAQYGLNVVYSGTWTMPDFGIAGN